MPRRVRQSDSTCIEHIANELLAHSTPRSTPSAIYQNAPQEEIATGWSKIFARVIARSHVNT